MTRTRVRPMDAWFAFRDMRFSHAEADRMAAIYRERQEAGDTPGYIARAICARSGLTPDVWFDKIREAIEG